MKTLKLKSDLFNKFSDYIKATNPDEFFEILEIQVKYNPKDEKSELERNALIINQLVEMQRAGMEVQPDWKFKSLKELQLMFKQYQEDIKDFDT